MNDPLTSVQPSAGLSTLTPCCEEVDSSWPSKSPSLRLEEVPAVSSSPSACTASHGNVLCCRAAVCASHPQTWTTCLHEAPVDSELHDSIALDVLDQQPSSCAKKRRWWYLPIGCKCLGSDPSSKHRPIAVQREAQATPPTVGSSADDPTFFRDPASRAAPSSRPLLVYSQCRFAKSCATPQCTSSNSTTTATSGAQYSPTAAAGRQQTGGGGGRDRKFDAAQHGISTQTNSTTAAALLGSVIASVDKDNGAAKGKPWGSSEELLIEIQRKAFGNIAVDTRAGPYLGDQAGATVGLKTLVLDLDETLVHSSFRPVSIATFIIPVEIEGLLHDIYVCKRPGVDEFLRAMHRCYEIVIFTASLPKYADPLMDQLDPTNLCSWRLFRESCTFINGSYVKDLSKLGRDLKNVIIIDNAPNSYALQPDNAIPIKSWFDDMNDRELGDLVPILEALAKVDDIPAVMRQTLSYESDDNEEFDDMD